MRSIADFVNRLTSRKFLGAAAAAYGFYAAHRYPEAAAVVVAYIAAEWHLDLTSLKKDVDAGEEAFDEETKELTPAVSAATVEAPAEEEPLEIDPQQFYAGTIPPAKSASAPTARRSFGFHA